MNSPFPNVYSEEAVSTILERLNKLNAETQPQWGKMNASQMLAHLSVSYDMAYGIISDKPSFPINLIMKWIIKPMVVGPKPYPKNGRTAPVFVIADERDFEKEKNRLIQNIKRVQQDGEKAFEGKESPNFGSLTALEWNNLFYKHLDHHFRQFGV